MAGTIVVGDAPLPGGGTRGRDPVPAQPGQTIDVPADQPTIQAAVDIAKPGDLVLVAPGTYDEGVVVLTPYLTIRGTDRNTVILDGGDKLANGIHVIEADGVTVENMTARHYQLNGFYWTGVFGYRGSYLTAYANGDYGIYAFDSVYGRIEHSYASGSPDSSFYIGQCQPCHAVIDDVIAEGSRARLLGHERRWRPRHRQLRVAPQHGRPGAQHARLGEAGAPVRRAHRRQLGPRQRQSGGADETPRVADLRQWHPDRRWTRQRGARQPRPGSAEVRHRRPAQPRRQPLADQADNRFIDNVV